VHKVVRAASTPAFVGLVPVSLKAACIYTKRAHVKQAFSHRLRRIFQNRKCAFSENKFPKVGKKWKRVRYLPFSKKSVHSGGQKSFKTHTFGRFRILFFPKTVNLVTRKSEENKNVYLFFGISISLLQI
jgi:hypothetical protein